MAEVELPDPEDIEEQKKNRFTRIVALTVAAYAVALAIASLGGSNAAKEMMLAQTEASNQWAFYQAKVIRQHAYRIEKLRLELELAERGASMPTEIRQKAETLRKRFEDEEQRYDAEKREIEPVARKAEAERDLNRKKDPYFDYGEVLLQIAIVIASVAMLAGSRVMYGFSLVLAVLGAFLAVNGFTLYFDLPFLGD